VITVWLPAARAPGNVLREADQALGHRPASPVRRGEPITDVRLLDDAGPGAGGALDAVAAPIRIADPAVAELLRAGMTVDVLAVPADGFALAAPPSMAELVGAGLRVLSVRTSDGADPGSGALVVVSTTAETAARLAAAQAGGRLSVTWHAGR
jgi:Flp pilus assembly protein CpaB